MFVVFNRATGQVFTVADRDDTVVDQATYDTIEVTSEPIANYPWDGSPLVHYYVDPATLEFRRKANVPIACDKNRITADGVDEARITVTFPEETEVQFLIDGKEQAVMTQNGTAVLVFSVDKPGRYEVVAVADRYVGEQTVVVEAI